MFSYVYMKLLEGRPRSYDRNMDRVSRGRVRRAKVAVAAEVRPDDRVLEIGCGTGELVELAVERGARVWGFDPSAAMLEVARTRLEGAGGVELSHAGVECLDTLPEGQFDLVLATLVLSELSEDERHFALRQAHRVLAPGGRLVLADEVRPEQPVARWVHAAVRLPQSAAAVLLTGSTTHPLVEPTAELSALGFEVERMETGRGPTVIVACRPEDP